MGTSLADILGYLASFFIVISFLMKDLKKIRIINFIGCLLFVFYGVLKGEGQISAMYWPVIIPNVVICFVQIYYLKKGH
ncbi:MAG: uroporphyrinogen decarboxylase [Bacteroidetes bacterium]|jgi:uncharacterized protein with PQ loop repeat|nr:uroporphyrinogen decarboxylase [Bacteroidota bacterium]